MDREALKPSLGEGLGGLFTTFFRIGLFTIGGGYAMIPLIEREIVERHRWCEKQEMVDLIAIAQSCPGIFAVNISIFVGYKLRGMQGAVMTALGTVMPSFLIILLIAMFFHQFEDNRIIAAMFRGIRPAVVALIAAPVFTMARSAKLNKYTLWIPVAATVAIWLLGVNPIWVIIAAGVGGFAWGKFFSEKVMNDE